MKGYQHLLDSIRQHAPVASVEVVAGRGEPNSRSQASEPMLMMQERPASRSRISTARKIPLRSPQNDRTEARACGSDFRVTIRNIAARLSGAATG